MSFTVNQATKVQKKSQNVPTSPQYFHVGHRDGSFVPKFFHMIKAGHRDGSFVPKIFFHMIKVRQKWDKRTVPVSLFRENDYLCESK